MNACDGIRELLGASLDRELQAEDRQLLQTHLESCTDCAEVAEALDLMAEASTMMQEIEPPDSLTHDLCDSPCQRWLGLLFAAIDHQIDDHNLARLLNHMEDCDSCRRAWTDMTLIHQTSEAMIPRRDLLARCIRVRNAVRRTPVLGKRAAVAAAYFLAVLASLVIGNPVILARNPAANAVQRVTDTMSTEITAAAADSRGEVRVILWRAWQWGSRQATYVRSTIADLTRDTDSAADQGGRT